MSDFVNFKLAQKLKEKGYPMIEIPIGSRDNRNIPVLYDLPKEHPNWQYCKAWWIPTISQVLKWLRKEKKLHIEFVGNACGYLYIVSDIPSEGGTDRYCSDYSGPNDGGTWNNYEDCALNAIQYVLDNFI